jgi:serine/threonine protein kinase
MTQLLLAIDFMHKRGIMHRDIKLDNILLSKMSEGHFDVKIADFGLAVKIPPKGLSDVCGSAGYMAPEILLDLPYTEKVDIFSLGSVFFNFMTGCFLFGGDNEEIVLQHNIRCNVEPMEKNLKHYSRLARDLFMQMVKKDPAKRPSAEAALKHPWFAQGGDH